MARFRCGNYWCGVIPLRKHSLFPLWKHSPFPLRKPSYQISAAETGPGPTSYVSTVETGYVSAAESLHASNFRSGNGPFLTVRNMS